MIAVLRNSVSKEQKDHLINWLKGQGLDVHISEGADYTVLGLVGDTSRIDPDLLQSLEMVQTVRRVSEPYKKASRKFHPDDSVISVGGVVSLMPSFIWPSSSAFFLFSAAMISKLLSPISSLLDLRRDRITRCPA